MVGKIAEAILNAIERRTESLGLAIQYAHRMPLRNKRINHMRADKAATAEHKRLHLPPSAKKPATIGEKRLEWFIKDMNSIPFQSPLLSVSAKFAEVRID
jgi:hypothetical protein